MSLLDQLRASNAAAGLAATAPTLNTPPAPAGPGAAAATPAPAAESPNTLPPTAGPTAACSCGFQTFWLDPYGNWHCQSCRPPKFAFLVRRAITIGSAGEISETRAADESRYDKFIEVIGADRRVHLVNRDCLDPRSDYFDTTITKKISLGVEEADYEFFATGKFLSRVLAEHGSIDRLPGPWPEDKPRENFSLAASAENPAGEKNKISSGKSASKPTKRAASGGARGGRRR